MPSSSRDLIAKSTITKRDDKKSIKVLYYNLTNGISTFPVASLNDNTAVLTKIIAIGMMHSSFVMMVYNRTKYINQLEKANKLREILKQKELQLGKLSWSHNRKHVNYLKYILLERVSIFDFSIAGFYTGKCGDLSPLNRLFQHYHEAVVLFKRLANSSGVKGKKYSLVQFIAECWNVGVPYHGEIIRDRMCGLEADFTEHIVICFLRSSVICTNKVDGVLTECGSTINGIELTPDNSAAMGCAEIINYFQKENTDIYKKNLFIPENCTNVKNFENIINVKRFYNNIR